MPSNKDSKTITNNAVPIYNRLCLQTPPPKTLKKLASSSLLPKKPKDLYSIWPKKGLSKTKTKTKTSKRLLKNNIFHQKDFHEDYFKFNERFSTNDFQQKSYQYRLNTVRPYQKTKRITKSKLTKSQLKFPMLSMSSSSLNTEIFPSINFQKPKKNSFYLGSRQFKRSDSKNDSIDIQNSLLGFKNKSSFPILCNKEKNKNIKILDFDLPQKSENMIYGSPPLNPKIYKNHNSMTLNMPKLDNRDKLIKLKLKQIKESEYHNSFKTPNISNEYLFTDKFKTIAPHINLTNINIFLGNSDGNISDSKAKKSVIINMWCYSFEFICE